MGRMGLLGAFLCALTFAYATTYDYLTFVTTSGQEQVSVSNLQLTVEGTNLVASNDEGSVTLLLADLQKMYFSDKNGEVTGATDVQFDDNQPVVVYTITGQQVGKFPALREAVLQLTQGEYLIKQASKTQKILVR